MRVNNKDIMKKAVLKLIKEKDYVEFSIPYKVFLSLNYKYRKHMKILEHIFCEETGEHWLAVLYIKYE